jgi:hypothetical protein
MSKINPKKPNLRQRENATAAATATVNASGYSMNSYTPSSSELELYKIASSTLLGKDTFYATGDAQYQKIKLLATKCSRQFLLALAVYLRHEADIRSTSSLLLVEAARRQTVAREPKSLVRFYTPFILQRMDEPAAVISAYQTEVGSLKNFPAALKRGIGDFLTQRATRYNLPKYLQRSNAVNLYDVFNLVHPTPRDENQAEVFRQFLAGELKNTETWEAKLSAAGKTGESKTETWNESVSSMGIMALCRNLRNMLQAQAWDAVKVVCTRLEDRSTIINSRMFPYQFWQAWTAITGYKWSRYASMGADYKSFLYTCGLTDSDNALKAYTSIRSALNTALRHSAQNLEGLDTDTMFILDVSGSMTSSMHSVVPAEIGSLLLCIGASAMKSGAKFAGAFFDSDTRAMPVAIKNLIAAGNIISAMEAMTQQFTGGYTNHDSAAKYAANYSGFPVQTVFTFTDEVSTRGHGTVLHTWQTLRAAAKSKYGFDANFFSVNLAGQTPSLMPSKTKGYTELSGFSDKIFSMAHRLTDSSDDAVIDILNRYSPENVAKTLADLRASKETTV